MGIKNNLPFFLVTMHKIIFSEKLIVLFIENNVMMHSYHTFFFSVHIFLFKVKSSLLLKKFKLPIEIMKTVTF